MPENTPETTDETRAQTRVLDYRHIRVTLTFDGATPIEIVLRRQLGKELKAEREQFFGMTEDEQTEQRIEFRARMLSNLIEDEPLGIPDFPFEGASLKDRTFSFFSDEKNEDLLSWIWGQYQVKLYPKEFMSSLSE